jgi:hypothetical protein
MQGNPNHGENHYRCRYPRDFAPALGMDHPPTVYVRESAIVPKLDEWIATLFASENLDETRRKLAEAGGASEADHARIGAAQRKLADCDRRLAGYQKTLDAGADPVIVAGWISQVQGERLRAERDLAAAQPSGRLTPKQARSLVEGLKDIPPCWPTPTRSSRRSSTTSWASRCVTTRRRGSSQPKRVSRSRVQL